MVCVRDRTMISESDENVVGYQGVRKIAVEGHPAVILGVTGVLAALPSIPCT